MAALATVLRPGQFGPLRRWAADASTKSFHQLVCGAWRWAPGEPCHLGSRRLRCLACVFRCTEIAVQYTAGNRQDPLKGLKGARSVPEQRVKQTPNGSAREWFELRPRRRYRSRWRKHPPRNILFGLPEPGPAVPRPRLNYRPAESTTASLVSPPKMPVVGRSQPVWSL